MKKHDEEHIRVLAYVPKSLYELVKKRLQKTKSGMSFSSFVRLMMKKFVGLSEKPIDGGE